MKIRKNIFAFITAALFLISCSNGMTSCTDNDSLNFTPPAGEPGGTGGPGGFGQGVEITDDGSTTNYTDTTTVTASAVIEADLYENFVTDGVVYINFDGSDVSITNTTGSISADDIKIANTENSEEDESAKGVEIQYKGKLKLKYVLSGTYTGTVFIKNKSADAAVVLNNVNITSDSGSGPVLRFSSEQRTFIVVPAGTTNTLTDTRVLNQSSTMYDDKKGSVYSKGALIFTGEASTEEGGTLNIVNTGYKHAVYTKDYVRIADLTLNITVDGETGRDCIRALTAVIIDDGNINLKANGTLEDDESNGIRVDGEDADEDDMTVEYTAGAGFVIINGGKLNITTVAKGITAHWKSAKSVIGNSSYDASGANKSLLCDTFLSGTSATTPNPYVEINGGIINITTTGEPYEGQTDDDPSCSPEGIEAKADLTINAGTLTIKTTDDSLNAGGNITINGGAVYACSSKNDAIDSNGTNGITINGGVIVAIGLNTPECAFDCDENPLTINGGTLVGLGTSNYTKPKSGTQSTIVLGSSSYGSAESTVAIVDSNGNPVFVYTLPSSTGEVMILSSPYLQAGSSYTVKTGVSIDSSNVVRFHNLYTTMPSISGGTSTLTDISTSSSNMVYTDSNAGNGFEAGGFGGQGGPGGPGGRSARGAFNGQRPDDMPEPPEGFNGQRPDDMPEPPEGFKRNGPRPDRS